MASKATTLDISQYYTPSPQQKKFHSSKAKFRLYGGAKGGGKTAALTWEAISTCLRIPGCNVLVLRRTFPQLEAGILNYFIQNVPASIYGGTRNFNKSKYTVTFPNGSRIWFRPCLQESDVYDYQGHEYVAILIDESTEFTYLMFDFLRKQLRYTRTKKDIYGDPIIPFMCLATNPGNIGHNWHKSLFVKHEPCEEMEEGAKKKYDKDDFAFVKALPTDNPHLPQEYIENLQTGSLADQQRYLYGSWDVFSGQYFERYSPERSKIYKFVAHQLVHQQKWQHRWIGIDWGYKDHTYVCWATRIDYTFPDGTCKNVTLIYRELLVSQMDAFELAAEIARACEYTNDFGAKIKETIDAIYLSPDAWQKRTAENTIAERLTEHLATYGLPACFQADTDRVGGWRFIDELLAPRPWPDLLISDECEELLAAIPLAIRDDKKQEDVKKSLNKTEDVLDGFRYAVKSRMEEVSTPISVEKAQVVSQCSNGNQKLFASLAFDQMHKNKGSGIRIKRRRPWA